MTEWLWYSYHVKSKKLQLIWLIQILFQWRFGRVYLVHFPALMMKKCSCKYHHKRITTRDNGNVEFHDQDQSKWDSSISTNSGGYTLAYGKKSYEKLIKSPFNKTNVRTTKRK